MDFSPALLFAGFVFGVAGFYIFLNGKKKSNLWHLILGIALMVYPYFISNLWLVWILGLALSAAAYKTRWN